MLRAFDLQQILTQSNSMERVQQAQQQHSDMQPALLKVSFNKSRIDTSSSTTSIFPPIKVLLDPQYAGVIIVLFP